MITKSSVNTPQWCVQETRQGSAKVTASEASVKIFAMPRPLLVNARHTRIRHTRAVHQAYQVVRRTNLIFIAGLDPLAFQTPNLHRE